MKKFRLFAQIISEYAVDVEAEDVAKADYLVLQMGVEGVQSNGTLNWEEMEIPEIGEELE